jgi:hypothetical protein
MNKKKHSSIDYKKVGSVLRSKGTKDLEDSVAQDLIKQEKPMSIQELIARQQEMYPDIEVGTHFQDVPVDEKAERQKEHMEQDLMDKLSEGLE